MHQSLLMICSLNKSLDSQAASDPELCRFLGYGWAFCYVVQLLKSGVLPGGPAAWLDLWIGSTVSPDSWHKVREGRFYRDSSNAPTTQGHDCVAAAFGPYTTRGVGILERLVHRVNTEETSPIFSCTRRHRAAGRLETTHVETEITRTRT